MTFVSLEFVAFLIVVCFVYFNLPYRYRTPALLLASYIFYGYWNVSYILLIAGSTWGNFVVAQNLAAKKPRRSLILLVGIVGNLAVLFIFKYYNFFLDTVTTSLSQLGVDYAVPALNILLPVGISFYTFQGMAYLIDVYRGSVSAETNLVRFATYIAFFPQLVAGPIERANHMLPQFNRHVAVDYHRIVSGLQIILWGAFKKIVIADRLAIYVNTVYNQPENYQGLPLLFATLFFAIQIYCDFSGYTDIAIGCARILGFNLMQNFRQPYFAGSIRDFWRRWHISLSTWFRDYLYIPLGGSRVAIPRSLLNLMIVFVVSGLWHGASWTFMAWGALHGLYTVVEVIFSGRKAMLRKPQPQPWPFTILSILFTFLAVLVAWVFFRANTLDDAAYIFTNALDLSNGFIDYAEPFGGALFNREMEFGIACVLIVFLLCIDALDARVGLWNALNRGHVLLRWAFYYALLFAIAASLWLYATGTQTFIYFQF